MKLTARVKAADVRLAAESGKPFLSLFVVDIETGGSCNIACFKRFPEDPGVLLGETLVADVELGKPYKDVSKVKAVGRLVCVDHPEIELVS